MKLKITAVLAALLTLMGSSAYAAATVEECQATFAKFKDLGNVPSCWPRLTVTPCCQP